MSKKQKLLPPFIAAEELSPFVEANTTLRKSELISRLAGNVRFEFLQLMKLLQFHQVSKNDKGELYLF